MTKILDLFPRGEALGAELFNDEMFTKFKDVTGQDIPYLIQRGIFHSQIGFDDLLERKRSGRPFYIFLSITPTDRLFNLRHCVMFDFARRLQASLQCKVVVHILDTKACLRDTNPKVNMAAVKKFTNETIRDILAFDFDKEKTFLLTGSDSVALDYVYLCDLQRSTKLGDFYEKFFDNDLVSVGQIDAVFQNACFAIPRYLRKVLPEFEDSRCLMLLRETQVNLYKFSTQLCGENPPMAIFGGFVPSLQGKERMPRVAKLALANKDVSYLTLYLKDKPQEITKKMNKNAISGGRDTREEQLEMGANLEVDIPFYYFKLLEEDNARVETICRLYGTGELTESETRMLTGDMKKVVVEVINARIQSLQRQRAAIKDDVIEKVLYRPV